MHMSSQDHDHIRYGHIAAIAVRRASGWRLTADGQAAAVAAVTRAAAGRADLLAKFAGLSLGYGERQPDAGHYRDMAELCIAAGADKTLIQRWAEVGRQRAATAAGPYTGYPPEG